MKLYKNSCTVKETPMGVWENEKELVFLRYFEWSKLPQLYLYKNKGKKVFYFLYNITEEKFFLVSINLHILITSEPTLDRFPGICSSIWP